MGYASANASSAMRHAGLEDPHDRRIRIHRTSEHAAADTPRHQAEIRHARRIAVTERPRVRAESWWRLYYAIRLPVSLGYRPLRMVHCFAAYRSRRVKIVATLGSTSNSSTTANRMIQNGVEPRNTAPRVASSLSATDFTA